MDYSLLLLLKLWEEYNINIKQICCEAEKCVDHAKTYWNRIHDRGSLEETEALAASAV